MIIVKKKLFTSQICKIIFNLSLLELNLFYHYFFYDKLSILFVTIVTVNSLSVLIISGQLSDVLDLVTFFMKVLVQGSLSPPPNKSLIGLHPSNNQRYPVSPVSTSVTSWLPYLSYANLTWKNIQAEDGPID